MLGKRSYDSAQPLRRANTSAVIQCSAKAVLGIQTALLQHLQHAAICHSQSDALPHG